MSKKQFIITALVCDAVILAVILCLFLDFHNKSRSDGTDIENAAVVSADGCGLASIERQSSGDIGDIYDTISIGERN